MKEPPSNNVDSSSEKTAEYVAVKQDEGPEEAKKSCFTFGTMKRTIRILTLLAILLIITLIPIIVIMLMYTHKVVTVGIDKPLKFVLRDCKLYIAESESVDVSSAKLTISLPGTSYDTNYGSTNEFIVKSSNTFTDACVVDMQINPLATLSGLEVNCIGTCYVSHMGPHALNLGTNQLVLTGATLHFMSVKLLASQVQAVVEKGNLHIYSLALTAGNTLNYMTTNEGDVVLQSVNSMQVQWTQPENNVCLYAPSISGVGNTVTDCKASLDLSTSSSSCSSVYMLCKSGDSCTSSLGAPTMVLSTGTGNVYANVITEDSSPVADSVHSVRGWNYTISVGFDATLSKTVASLVERLNGSAQADPVIWLGLGNSHTFSSASMTYLLVNNMAYLNANPWWISFFSGSLLLGRINKLEGNLAPGFCPFRPLPTTTQLSTVRELILSSFSSRADAAYVYGTAFPKITAGIQSGTGFRGTESALKLYEVEVSGGQYNLKAYGLAESLSLLLAVIISLVLAVLMGVLIFYVFLVALDKLLDHFLQQYKHINAYSQRMKRAEPSESLGIRPDQVADARMGKEKPEIEEKHILIVSVFSRLPSQYMLIDIMVGELRRMMTNAVEEFTEFMFEKQKPDDVDDFQPMLYSEIKDVFEQLCFLRQFPEQDLLSAENQQHFVEKGFVFKQQGHEVESLIKIRWLKEEEIIEAQIGEDRLEVNDSSLDLFFKTHCATTPFPADTIDFEAFKKAYADFCEEKRMHMSVLTRAQLHDTFGIESITQVPYYLIRAQRNANSQLYKVNLEQVRERIRSMIEANSDNPKAAPKMDMRKVLTHIKSYRSFLFDILSVVLHFVCLAVLGCVPFILPLFVELELSNYTMSDYRYKMKYDDFTYSPWNILYKLQYLATITIVCFCVGGFYIVMGIIELIVYYRYMSFEALSLRSIQKMKFSMVSRIINAVEWGYICIIIAIVAMYIVLVGVWSILGTILNPNAYLAYGAAAVTLVSFIGTKISEFRRMNFMGIQALQEMLFSKLQGLLDDIMKKVLSQAGFATDSGNKDGENEGGLLDRASRAIRSTSVGKAMVAAGLDPKNVVCVLEGDDDALVELGVKQGVPKIMMKLLLAMIRYRRNDVIACVQELAASPQLNINPEIINVAIDTITNSSELNVPVIITNLAKAFFNIAHKQITSKATDEDSLAYLEICKQIFPRVITALRSFRMEDLDTFLEHYESINEFLHDSVKKRSAALTTTQNQVFKRLFNAKGEPIFALPSYILKAIRIFSLAAVSDEGKVDDSRIGGITSAIFYILENFFGADRKVTSVLNLLLATSPEKLSPVEGEGTMPIEEQENVLNYMSEILGVPGTLIRIAWKTWTGNYTVDDAFVKDMREFFEKMVGCKLDEGTIRFVMQIFSIASTRLSRDGLIKDAAKFGVESNVANVVDLFGLGKMSPDQCKAMMRNTIFQAISDKLQIVPNQSMGVIALIKGDFACPYVLELFDSLKKRWGLQDLPMQYVTAMLSIFLSEDESELISALGQLNIFPAELLLVGKRLLHPGNVSDKIFDVLGLPRDNPNVSCRKFVQMDNSGAWDEWVRSMVRLLSAEFRPVKAPAAESKIPPPGAKPTPSEGSSVPETKREEEKKLPSQKTLDEPHPAARVVDTHEDSRKGSNFTAEEKRMRADAKLLVGIADAVVNESTVLELLARVPIPIDKKVLSLTSDIIVTLVRAIRSLREGATENKVKDAAGQIADLLNINVQPLMSILSIVLLRNQQDVISGITRLVKKSMSKHEADEAIEYCTFALNKSKVLKNLEGAVVGLADQLKIPKFMVKLVLSPLSDEGNTKVSIEEFLMLLDQAGINAEAFTALGFTFRWPYGGEVTVEELRYYLSGILIGNSEIIKALFMRMGIPPQALNLACSMTSENKTEIMKELFEAACPIMERCGVPRRAFYVLLELYKFLYGSGNESALDPEAGKMSGYDYLKRKLGVLPRVLICLEATIARDVTKLVDEIPNLIKEFDDFDRLPEAMKIKPEVVSGLMTIITGNNKSLENMAESMDVKQELIELCLKLTNITKGSENDIENRVVEFMQSPSIAKVWSTLGIPVDVIESFLMLTFRTYNLEAPSRLLQKLNMAQHADIGFLQFLLSITNSYATLQSVGTPPMYRDTERRHVEIENLKKYMTPVCKRLAIDPDLALIGVRLRQGDFYIIEDYADYLSILLPSENIRKMAMGITGMLTLPITFKRSFGTYPEEFKADLSFESACEMICDMLNINPIVPRMMMLDDVALNLIESKYGFSRKAIAWLIIALTNMPIFLLEGIALKEFKKMVYLKQLELEELLKDMEREEAKIDAETKPQAAPEAKTVTHPPTPAAGPTVPPEETKNAPLPPSPVPVPPPDIKSEEHKEGEPLLPPPQPQPAEGAAPAPASVPPPGAAAVPVPAPSASPAPGEAPASVPAPAPADGAAPPVPAPEAVDLAKSADSMKMKKLLKVMRSSMLNKVKSDENDNYYDKINFDDPMYDDVGSKIYTQDSLSYLNEMLEVLLFNTEKYVKMDYDYVTSNQTREGAFMVSDERITELFGTRAEYYAAMAKSFYCNPEDPSIWQNKETLNLGKSWTNKGERNVRKNVWAELKKVLHAISGDRELLGSKRKYDNITLGQLSLFMLLIRLRKRLVRFAFPACRTRPTTSSAIAASTVSSVSSRNIWECCWRA